MQLFYEIIPVFLFFIAFKFYDIYVATVVGIVTTLIQVILTRVVLKKWDNKQLITLSVFLFFGGMTLYFHDPIFVKWKPTIIFWIFSLVILFTQFFSHRPLMQRLMENALQDKACVPKQVWKQINLLWGMFFIFLGGINLYIAYHYSNDTWVNFKFYGITSAFFILSIAQALFLMRYMSEEKHQK
ncbi:MAG: hypothetical protein ACD_46C00184G0010 [uncultured bacterium]|nr:MAG: hypothetical protein ACD_46C00184G0010 [uncultured bacterium]